MDSGQPEPHLAGQRRGAVQATEAQRNHRPIWRADSGRIQPARIPITSASSSAAHRPPQVNNSAARPRIRRGSPPRPTSPVDQQNCLPTAHLRAAAGIRHSGAPGLRTVGPYAHRHHGIIELLVGAATAQPTVHRKYSEPPSGRRIQHRSPSSARSYKWPSISHRYPDLRSFSRVAQATGWKSMNT